MTTFQAWEAGVHQADLQDFMERLKKNGLNMHSVLMSRYGKRFFECYWDPFDAQTNHRMYSVTKSFVAIAIGCLVDEGKLGLDDPIIDYFPDKLTENTSEHNRTLKIRHLLMMATGHPGNEVHARGKFSDEEYDKLKDFFHSETIDMPGTLFQYENIASYVLSNLVSRVNGENIVEYLTPRFLQSLGITIDYYSTDENGVCMGYSGFRITLESLAKVGQFLPT